MSCECSFFQFPIKGDYVFVKLLCKQIWSLWIDWRFLKDLLFTTSSICHLLTVSITILIMLISWTFVPVYVSTYYFLKFVNIFLFLFVIILTSIWFVLRKIEKGSCITSYSFLVGLSISVLSKVYVFEAWLIITMACLVLFCIKKNCLDLWHFIDVFSWPCEIVKSWSHFSNVFFRFVFFYFLFL